MGKTKYKKPKEKIATKITLKGGYIKDLGIVTSIPVEKTRREFGAHLTSIDIFKKFIFPEIKDILYKYVWVDLFCGEGNLILPILEVVPKRKRENFFKEHIFLFDIQKEMVKKSIKNAQKYGISPDLSRKLK